MNQTATPNTDIDPEVTKELADALVNFREVLTSRSIQQMTDPTLEPTAKKIIDSTYAEARACLSDANAPATITDFLAASLAQCDQALSVLEKLPDHEGWEPEIPALLEYTLGRAAWAMGTSYSAACITARMREDTAPLRDKMGGANLPWTQQTLAMLASCMLLATDQYDTPSAAVTILRKLRSRVLPLMTGDYSSLAVDTLDDITEALGTHAPPILMVGVLQDGMGVTSYLKGPGIAVDEVGYLCSCDPILMLEGGDWKQITYTVAEQIAR